MFINPGKFEGDTYVKEVEFSKAVLWKDKQISLNQAITSQFAEKGTKTVIFIDEGKSEKWSASVEDLRKVAVLKKEGQEPQYYFPISAFQVEKIAPPPKPRKKKVDAKVEKVEMKYWSVLNPQDEKSRIVISVRADIPKEKIAERFKEPIFIQKFLQAKETVV